MKTLLKSLLIPALCAFFLLQAQQANAQSKDNDVLVMEFGYAYILNAKTYGIYVYWPDKDMEFTKLPIPNSPESVIANKKSTYKKINDLSDLGWELDIVLNNDHGDQAYYFKKAAAQ